MFSIFRGFVAALVIAGAGYVPVHYANASHHQVEQYAKYVQQTNQNEQVNFLYNDNGE